MNMYQIILLCFVAFYAGYRFALILTRFKIGCEFFKGHEREDQVLFQVYRKSLLGKVWLLRMKMDGIKIENVKEVAEFK